MRHWFAFIILAAIVVGQTGCAPFLKRKHLDYRTVVADPNHDTEMAKAENERAARLVAKGKLDAAEQALQSALVADVTYGPAHNNLGKVFFARCDYYLAAWEFEYARRLMPEAAEPNNNLGLVYEAVEKLDEAVAMYTIAYQMRPEDPEIIGNLARVRMKRDERDGEARRLLSELILYDTRPCWVDWAREHLALGESRSARPLEEIPPPATGASEIISDESLPPPAPVIEPPFLLE